MSRLDEILNTPAVSLDDMLKRRSTPERRLHSADQ